MSEPNVTTPNTIVRGTLLEPETVSEIFNLVRGRSTVAVLAGNTPIAFNGNEFFTFSMDDEADLVGETEPKSAGKAALVSMRIRPYKLEYGARFSDEFIYGTEEKKLEVMKAFADGASKKFARGLDIVSLHGMNPRSKAIATALGDNYMDKALTDTSNKITYDANDPEGNLEDAVALLGDYDVTGFAFAKPFASALAKMKVNGVKQYPEFALGANPGSLNGIKQM
ncbi:MAG: phage major capsid protein [Solobacterium sp.]|nr:phage major capsid protein [Solobacterium sp.]